MTGQRPSNPRQSVDRGRVSVLFGREGLLVVSEMSAVPPPDASIQPKKRHPELREYFQLLPARLTLSSPPLVPPPILTVSQASPQTLDEPHELYDQPTLTTPFSRQRQQPQHSAQIDPPLSDPSFPAPVQPVSPSSSTSSHSTRRSLRRAERRLAYSGRTSLTPVAHQPTTVRFATQPEPATRRDASYNPPLSESQTGGDHSTYVPSLQTGRESFWPRRTTQISSRTASAIVWALEEAIRKPLVFTLVLDEVNASMSELMSGAQPSGSIGNGRPPNGSTRTMPGAPMSQPNPPSGVRTPTDIMRQRRDREARKKAEQEAELRRKQEQEQQQIQLDQFPQPARQQPTAVGVAAESISSPQRRPGGTITRPPEMALPQDPGPRRDRAAAGGSTRIAPAAGVAPGMQPAVSQPTTTTQQPTRQRGTSISQGQPRPAPAQAPPSCRATGTYPQPQTGGSSAQTSQQPEAPEATQIPQGSGPQGTQPAASQQTQPQSQQQQQARTRPPFPHAFERWETLSSHWEGLTGYWIRRLEQSNEELSRDPLSQQMSRQITDLSAAGANLFHAVVELQRLRASSERKFQRWFFDTRAEQERGREMQAELERLLRVERQARSEAVTTISKAEADKAKAEELVKEMRRELQISKEEARRAWEELGRREQEERDRTLSLRNGEPTIVGGVQVVPMMQSLPSRQTSTNRPPTREGPYPGGPGPTSMGGQTSRRGTNESAEEYQYGTQVSSPTAADPFIEGGRDPSRQLHHEPDNPSLEEAPARQPSASATAMSAATTASMEAADVPSTTPYSQPYSAEDSRSRFYQQEQPSLHGDAEPRVTEGDDRSYVPSTEGGGSDLGSEEYEIGPDGTYRRDSQGRRIVYPRTISDDSDDYDHPEQPGSEGQYGQRYGQGYGDAPPSGTHPEMHSGFNQGVDYTGSGWGMTPGWDSVTPRHRHPTRLSDVLEEDERSRTSPSRASQASRSMH
ncbi:hypothetical protein AJ80_05929 [Polytolypa hystricis UAMH7299]|uniref:Uncharacterized protein n=1 Tax=Polytolypa hystricis (strain UAMH7299) TaxID=1447883 RepID=A0A2B7XZJ5_POLH7|nr:hypothetical protein AJ80_05929 [Polytolypa hystricis UAMH7299]